MWMDMFMSDKEKNMPGSPANLKHLFNHNGATKDCKNYYDSYNLCELVTRTNIVSLARTLLLERPVTSESGFLVFIEKLYQKIQLFGRFQAEEISVEVNEDSDMFDSESGDDEVVYVEDKINENEVKLSAMRRERDLIGQEPTDTVNEMDIRLYEQEQELIEEQDQLMERWLEMLAKQEMRGASQKAVPGVQGAGQGAGGAVPGVQGAGQGGGEAVPGVQGAGLEGGEDRELQKRLGAT